MNRLARTLIVFTVLFHLVVFVVEAFLWMQPAVHQFAAGRLGAVPGIDVHTQAVILRTLFINQGFYNLFLAMTGVAGLVLLKRGNTPASLALVSAMCLSAVGAGIVLAATTPAYAGAFMQGVPPALALLAMLRSRRAGRTLHN